MEKACVSPPLQKTKQERLVQHPFGGQGGGGGRVLTVHDRWNKELKIQLLLSRKKYTFLLLSWPRFVNEFEEVAFSQVLDQ